MILIRIFIIGLVVLVGAIAVNLAAGALGLPSWYTFLGSLPGDGLAATLRRMPVLHLFYLFVVYPLLLGCFSWLGIRLTGSVF